MKRTILTLLVFLFLFLKAYPDEGMWMLTDLQKQNELAMIELGLEIPVTQIYNPDGISLKDAVVHFG
ncbi:MAG: S46 family peptidase, partial [Prevotellaceae bacterium]|nr:S46 family peptidase [Prevotellaceae bacterium]